MRSMIKLTILLIAGALAISGCSAVRSMLTGESDSADPSVPESVAAPALPQFTFYESWASW